MFQILLVDDHRHQVDSIAKAIPWEALEVTEIHKAYSGFEALQLLEKYAIDIVVTDIRMPGMNGIQLIEQIRARWNKTKCILLSGYAEFEYAKQAIQLQTTEYLLKPFIEDELMEAIRRSADDLKRDWSEIASQRRAIQTVKTHLPKLRNVLLNELLEGKIFREEQLRVLLSDYSLDVRPGDTASILVIRMDDCFRKFSETDRMLYEYAVVNIAEEILGEHFHVWHGNDNLDLLTFLVKPRDSDGDAGEGSPRSMLERCALQTQQTVNRFLKGTVSVVLSGPGIFPDSLYRHYQACLSAIRLQAEGKSELFIPYTWETTETSFRPLLSLYEHPALHQLLESGRWEQAREKLLRVFDEATQTGTDSHEHLTEIYLKVAESLMYISHKNGCMIDAVLGEDSASLFEATPFRTVQSLQDWSLRCLARVIKWINSMHNETTHIMIRRVQDYLRNHFSGDTSLQTIADYVHLHPVYLSRLYKAETGEGISEYLLKLRMDKAEQLLTGTRMRIQDISAQLGYDNTQYFIKVFKRHFGTTPGEFRELH